MTDKHFTLSGHETGDGRQLGPGTRLGQFELREPLGAGAMGQVWKAWDIPGQREVAVKMLPEALRDNPTAIAQVRESFNQVEGLTHQHIGGLLVMDVDPVYGPYIVMKLIPGSTLTNYARTYRQEHGSLPVSQVVQLLEPIAAALDYAHSRGVLHRDVKTDNILIQTQPTLWPVLIDFGLAAAIRSTVTRHTQGTVDSRGTRPYMSPEQLRGKSRLWDGRTDQYSLAVVAYELLGGYLPFEADDDFVFMHAIIHESPDPIDGLPENVNAALLRGLAKERDDRFASCRDFIAALAPAAAPPVAVAPAPQPVQPAVPVPAQSPAAMPMPVASHPADPLIGQKAGDLWEGNSLGMKFRWCPPGTFTMGSPPDELQRAPKRLKHLLNEDQVSVTLTRGFWLGQYSVTQGEYAAIMGANPSWFNRDKLRTDTSRYPVEWVSWEEAQIFCQRLTEQERAAGTLPANWSFTLPTEAQWEYACRAGTTTATAFGSSLSSRQANFDGNSPYNIAEKGEDKQQTVPVGSYQPNAWNLYDMHGNVSEWCRDFFARQNPGGTDPEVREPTGYRVERGGGWRGNGGACRSANRSWTTPDDRFSDRGFRVALVQTTEQEPAVPPVQSAIQVVPPLVKPPVTPQPDPFAGRQAGDLWEGNSLGMKFRWCPPGSFLMGSPPDEPDGCKDENQVPVTFTRGFWLGQYEVTQAEYSSVIGVTPSFFTSGVWHSETRRPVEQVSWEDAMEFCRKLTQREQSAGHLPADWEFTLPTEAQWEYACRAGTTTATAFGDNLSSAQANFNGERPYNGAVKGESKGKTVAVGSYPPNPWNLYDMHGNVWEWCRDWYAEQPPGGVDPEVRSGIKDARYRIYRGGSWHYGGSGCRSAFRLKATVDFRYNTIGFRVALVQSPPAS